MNKYIYIVLAVLIFLFKASIANAANITVVSSSSCKNLANTQQPFMLVLSKGQDVIEAIVNCANAAGLDSASLSGLGAVETPTLAYYNVVNKQYQYKTFAGVYELLGLTGNVTQLNGKRFAHIHVVLGNAQYQVIGGHLDGAQVGATVEITVVPFKTAIARNFDAVTGLQLMAPSISNN